MFKALHQVSLITLLLALPLIAIGQEAGAKRAKQRDGVFVHISHGKDDPHRLLMGFQMATTMAEAGKDVIVYCDIEAVHVLTADAPDIEMKPFKNLHSMLDGLQKKGVIVMACPTCMKVAGIEPAALRRGITVADKDKFFTFTKGRILTIDY